MKLLILTNKPERASCKQRIGIYLDILKDNGIDSDIVVFPSGILKRLKLLKQASDYDAVLLQKKRLRFWDAICLKYSNKKVIYDLDDAIMYSDKTPQKNSPKRRRLFKRTAGLADIVLAGNEYLAEHAKKYNPNVIVLPTGLHISEYDNPGESVQDEKIRLVWIGSKNTLKYLAQLKPALEEIGRRFDNTALRIICNHFFDLENIPVEKHIWSLESQASDLCTSDIGLAPLPDDRFTRGKCGFKILQYQAASLPVIASPVGVNAQFVQPDISGYHASTTDQWIEAISKLIQDKEKRKQMGRQGRKHVEEFDVDVIGHKLCKIIKETIKYV